MCVRKLEILENSFLYKNLIIPIFKNLRKVFIQSHDFISRETIF